MITRRREKESMISYYHGYISGIIDMLLVRETVEVTEEEDMLIQRALEDMVKETELLPKED